MDKITSYNSKIIDVLNEYNSQFRLSSQDIKNEVIIDEKRHHYQFLWTGWNGDNHIFAVIFHIDIINDKIWIQQDNSEIGFATLLVEKGVPKQDIVLAYYPVAHRKLTEYAVA